MGGLRGWVGTGGVYRECVQNVGTRGRYRMDTGGVYGCWGLSMPVIWGV